MASLSKRRQKSPAVAGCQQTPYREQGDKEISLQDLHRAGALTLVSGLVLQIRLFWSGSCASVPRFLKREER